MRQKEKRRVAREAAERQAAADLQRRRETPGDPLFVTINFAECKCGCEFDPRVTGGKCPCCK